MSDQELSSPTKSLQKRSWATLFHRLLGWLAVLVLFSIPVARLLTYEVDHAIANLATMVLGLQFAILAGIWFLFHPRISRMARGLAFVLGVMVIFGLVKSLRFQGFSGEMVPRFELHRDRPSLANQSLPPSDFSADRPSMVDEETPSFAQLLGNHRDGTIRDVRLDPDWSSHPPEVLWKREVGAGWSGIAVAKGRLVTVEQWGDQESVRCYRMETGELLWKVDVEARHYDVLGGLGPRCTPTIDGNHVYTLGATGIVQAIEWKTGKLVWKADLLKLANWTQAESEAAISWGRSASPLIYRDSVVVPFGGPSSKTDRSLIAFDKQTGIERWRAGKDQISYSSPIAGTWQGTEVLVIVNENSVTGHAPEDGRLLWETPWPGHSNRDASASQPIAVSNDQIFISKGYSGGGGLFQLELGNDGRWQVDEIWSNPSTLRTKFTSPVLVEKSIYGLSDGILECCSLTDGKRMWKKGRYGHGQLLAVGQHLVVSSEAGQLVLLEATAKEWRELGKFPVLSGTTWNIPSIAGDRVYMRNAEEMACIRIPTSE